MRYLVTGGAGFIGSNIVKELVKQKEEIIVVDNLSTGKLSNIKDVLDKIKFIKADIREKDVVKIVTKNIDYILHHAAIPSVVRSIEDPILCNDANVVATLNLLYYALKNKVKRFIYASSSSVYGDTPNLPKREDDKPNPISPYGISKLAAEHYCQVFYKIYGLETVALRYFNVFGIHQDFNSEYSAVIPKFIFRLLKDKKPIIYGDGNQTRDFTYVKNVVDANLLATHKDKARGEIFNISSGKNISINELLNILNLILKKNILPIYTSSRKGDIKHSLADITKAQKLLNYKVSISQEEGLRLTVAWLQKSLE